MLSGVTCCSLSGVIHYLRNFSLVNVIGLSGELLARVAAG